MKSSSNDLSREEPFPVKWLVIPDSEAELRRESDDISL